jgi:hypothetical protein
MAPPVPEIMDVSLYLSTQHIPYILFSARKLMGRTNAYGFPADILLALDDLVFLM